jgi:hypothetical protein
LINDLRWHDEIMGFSLNFTAPPCLCIEFLVGMLALSFGRYLELQLVE